MSCVTLNAGEDFSPFYDDLRSQLIPTLTGRPPASNLEFTLFSLLAHLGGLGVRIPSKDAEIEVLSTGHLYAKITHLET